MKCHEIKEYLKDQSMTNSFSERHGIIKPTSLNLKDMPDRLRNRIWNIMKKCIEDSGCVNKVIEFLWDKFFGNNVDDLRRIRSNTLDGLLCTENELFEYQITEIKDEFYPLAWNRVYDFLEFLLQPDLPSKISSIGKLNLVFIDEGVQYKIIDGLVTPLISGEEAEEVEKAVECKYLFVSGHIKKALELYRKRPVADYENSIKESISAIEALARIVLKKPSATLGELADQLEVHTAFQKAIKILYGWTSDQGGIRHAEKSKELKIDEKEARYMLVQCSALVNYIISKY